MSKILELALSGSLLISCFAPPLLAQNNPADEVRQMEERWSAAIKGQDRETLEAILAEDLVYTHSSGSIEDKGQYITAVTSGSLRYDTVNYEEAKIRIYGIAAVVTTKATMSGSNKGQPFNVRLQLLHVWVRQAGKWTLVAHQTTRLP